MTFRMLLRLAAVLPFFLALGAIAQSGGGRADIKDHVLDILFSRDASTAPYLSKMTLRFGDSDSQFVVLVYPGYPVHPGGRAELIRYSIAGLEHGQLSQLISKMLARNPKATDQEIAAKFKVEISHSPIGYDALNASLDRLKAIHISPVLANRVAVDEYSEYEFWYDVGQDSVRYTVSGPFNDAPQDELVQWMLKFRTNVPELLKAASVPEP